MVAACRRERWEDEREIENGEGEVYRVSRLFRADVERKEREGED